MESPVYHGDNDYALIKETESNANSQKTFSNPNLADLEEDDTLVTPASVSSLPKDSEESLPEPEPPEPFALLGCETNCQSCEEVIKSSHEEQMKEADTPNDTKVDLDLDPPTPISNTVAIPNPEEITETDAANVTVLDSVDLLTPIPDTASCARPKVPAALPIRKSFDPTKPLFRIRYASDTTLSFVLLSPITPTCLMNILVQHTTLKFVTFHRGVFKDRTPFVFQARITLPSLKKITFHIPPLAAWVQEQGQGQSAIPIPLPTDFVRLFHFLKEITYGQLEHLRINCDPLSSIHIPLASAFFPSYEPEGSHPFTELILKNRGTLQSIVIGRVLNEMSIKLIPAPCDLCPGTCEPKNFPKMQSFVGFPHLPLLSSWSVMLQRQKHLTNLSVTLSHEGVLRDINSAIRSSRHSLQSFSFNLIPIDGKSVTLDLKVLRDCGKLKELSLQFAECTVIGWGFVPGSITTLNFLGGSLTHTYTEQMSLALPHLEEVNVFLPTPPAEKKILDKICDVGVSPYPPDNEDEDLKPIQIRRPDLVVVDIVHDPVFHFVKAASKSLQSFNVETDVGVEIDWEKLRPTLAYQKEFKLIERKENGDFSLERELFMDQEDQGKGGTDETPGSGGQGLVETRSEHSFFRTCVGYFGIGGKQKEEVQ